MGLEVSLNCSTAEQLWRMLSPRFPRKEFLVGGQRCPAGLLSDRVCWLRSLTQIGMQSLPRPSKAYLLMDPFSRVQFAVVLAIAHQL